MSISAKDVQALRQATGAGMMDAKRALEETDGDFDAAAKSLREKGLAKSVDRSDRENTQGAVAVGRRRRRRRHRRAQVRDRLRRQVRRVPRRARPARRRRRRRRRGRHRRAQGRRRRPQGHAQGEHRASAGSSASRSPPARPSTPTCTSRRAAASTPSSSCSTAATPSWPTRSPCHAAFSKPRYLSRDEVPEAEAAEERATLEGITRAEGKPEQAIEKIVEGRLNAWYKDQVLLEQPYAQGRQAVDHAAARRRHHRPLRPGLHRLLTDRPLPADPAQALRRGLRRDGQPDRRQGRGVRRRRDRRGPRARRRGRRRRRRRQHLAGHDRRRRRAWTAPRPTTWACWPRSSTPSPCRTPSSGSGSPPGCRAPSTWPRWPSRTSAARPSGTSRRAGS